MQKANGKINYEAYRDRDRERERAKDRERERRRRTAKILNSVCQSEKNLQCVYFSLITFLICRKQYLIVY